MAQRTPPWLPNLPPRERRRSAPTSNKAFFTKDHQASLPPLFIQIQPKRSPPPTLRPLPSVQHHQIGTAAESLRSPKTSGLSLPVTAAGPSSGVVEFSLSLSL